MYDPPAIESRSECAHRLLTVPIAGAATTRLPATGSRPSTPTKTTSSASSGRRRGRAARIRFEDFLATSSAPLSRRAVARAAVARGADVGVAVGCAGRPPAHAAGLDDPATVDDIIHPFLCAGLSCARSRTASNFWLRCAYDTIAAMVLHAAALFVHHRLRAARRGLRFFIVKEGPITFSVSLAAFGHTRAGAETSGDVIDVSRPRAGRTSFRTCIQRPHSSRCSELFQGASTVLSRGGRRPRILDA